MGLLKWETVKLNDYSRPFWKAEIVNLQMDFIDICKDRYWGGSTFYLNIKFSIHERIVRDSQWAYQLLAPNGIHIYCKDIEEAKAIAEQMYARIRGALLERLQPPAKEPDVGFEIAKKLNKALDYSKMTRHCRHTKHKTKKLFAYLQKRGIEGRVYFSRLRRHYGWHFSQNGSQPLMIGTNYATAINMINCGALDIYKNDDCIINIGEVG